MEEHLIAVLRAADAVTALTGMDRINFGAHPQNEPWPGLVLHLVGGFQEASADGVSGSGQGRVQIDCIAKDYVTALTLGRAVRTALDGYRGGPVRGVFCVAIRDGREGVTSADRPFRISLDLMVHFTTPKEGSDG